MNGLMNCARSLRILICIPSYSKPRTSECLLGGYRSVQMTKWKWYVWTQAITAVGYCMELLPTAMANMYPYMYP